MRLIIKALLESAPLGTAGTDATILTTVVRQDRRVDDLGVTFAQGRAVLAGVPSTLVSQRAACWLVGQLACHQCGCRWPLNPSRLIRLGPVKWDCRKAAGHVRLLLAVMARLA